MLGKCKLESEQTEIVLLAEDAFLNSRPLTCTYTDTKRSSLASPQRTNDYEARSAQATRRDSKKLRYCQKLVDHQWIRWKKEHLLWALHLCPAYLSSSLVKAIWWSRSFAFWQMVLRANHRRLPWSRWHNSSTPSESLRKQVFKNTCTQIL